MPGSRQRQRLQLSGTWCDCLLRRQRAGADGGGARYRARHCGPGQGKPDSAAAVIRHDAAPSQFARARRPHPGALPGGFEGTLLRRSVTVLYLTSLGPLGLHAQVNKHVVKPLMHEGK